MNPQDNPQNTPQPQQPPQQPQPSAQPGYVQQPDNNPAQPQVNNQPFTPPTNANAPQAYRPQPTPVQPQQVPQPAAQPQQFPQPQQPQQNPQPLPGQPKQGLNKKLIIAIVAIPLVLGLIAVLIVVLSGGSSEQSSGIVNRSEADTLRATHAVELGNALVAYSDDNNGELLTITPQAVGNFSNKYLPSQFTDPETGEAYQLVTEEPQVGMFEYRQAQVCTQDGGLEAAGDRTFAVRTRLSDDSLYCLDSTTL